MGYFLGSALITPKITLVAEDLLIDVIKENIHSKKNSIAFEFNRLNSYLIYSENLIENYIVKQNVNTKNPSKKDSIHKLKDKLQFVTELAQSTNLITSSFVYSTSTQNIEDIHFANLEGDLDVSTLESISKQLVFNDNKAFIDTIITTPKHVINRKVYARKINSETIIVVGYDISLVDFWAYFSETSKSGSGYTVVTNKDGICILHPEKENIGHKQDGFFESISIAEVLQQDSNHRNFSLKNPENILKDTAVSKFLDLEVLRYYDKVTIGKESLILIESFPVDIKLKEATAQIQRYFSWISLLAFLTFLSLLLISRIQLKKEYTEKLTVVEEKEKLEIANEKYQKENALLQLDQLKEKMKPHFLFNSLNSLHVLIASKPDLSQEFVARLANVYRYLLVGKEGNLMRLREEIEFMNQYIFLQEIRFNDSLNVQIVYNKEDQTLNKKIPFLSLQSLVENAIKHNVVTKDNPLNIKIIITQDAVLVCNNYTPRNRRNIKSHKLGLAYLKNIYEYHNVYTFKAKLEGDEFCCTLPLLI